MSWKGLILPASAEQRRLNRIANLEDDLKTLRPRLENALQFSEYADAATLREEIRLIEKRIAESN